MASQRPAKRGAPGTSGASEAEISDEPVPRSELQEMLDQFQNDISTSLKADINKAMCEFESRATANLSAQTATLLSKYDKVQASKFEAIRSEIDELNNEMRKLREDKTVMQDSIRQLQRGLAIAEQAIPQEQDLANNDEWDRPLQHNLLRLGTAVEVSKKEVMETVTNWLSELNFAADAWSVLGPELGTQFTLTFSGATGLACQRAKLANKKLRSPDGVWRRLHVTHEGGEEDLFISRDRNGRMRAQHRMGRRMVKAIRELHPNKHAVYREGANAVFVQSKPVAKPLAETYENKLFKWDYAQLDKVGLVKEALLQKYTEIGNSAASANNGTWSI